MGDKQKEREEGKTQNQRQINKQLLDLDYSYEILGNLLSSAENFAGVSDKQYEKYNISKAKSHDELKSEFAWELNCFQISLKKYKEKHGEYIFPEGYSKEKIIKDIQGYIENTSAQKDKDLFLLMIDIINENEIEIDFDKLFEELESNSENKIDPNKLNSLIGPINNHLDNIEKNAEEGKIVFNNQESKLKEKIKNEEINITDKITGSIGKKGSLIIVNESHNEYKFIYGKKNKEKTIFLEGKIDLEQTKLYSGKLEEKSIIIYLDSKKNNCYSCSLFNKGTKEYEKSDVVILDNNYGFLKVPFLLGEDLK